MTHPPVVVTMDVSDLNSLAEKVASIEQTMGHIDILINNAGIGVRGDIVSMAVDLDVQVMLVNYFGGVAITKGLYAAAALNASQTDQLFFPMLFPCFFRFRCLP